MSSEITEYMQLEKCTLSSKKLAYKEFNWIQGHRTAIVPLSWVGKEECHPNLRKQCFDFHPESFQKFRSFMHSHYTTSLMQASITNFYHLNSTLLALKKGKKYTFFTLPC